METKKKILILGANVTECFIVERAKSLGYYTVVTDNNTNRYLSPAKEISDESWDISWSDITTLADRCKFGDIRGVIAGFSEFRVESQIKLCKVLGLPCHISFEQLNLTRDKQKFKAACINAGIPVVSEYGENEAVEHLPVIVKPVDRAGSIGITIAYTETEFQTACAIAKKASPTNKIIIEKYMEHCIKFDAYYVIQNGKIFLVGSNDTLMCPPVKGHEVLQSSWVFPSSFQEIYREKMGKKVEVFLNNIGIKDGYITISAFVDEESNFHVFETGFRLSGELSFIYTKFAYGIDYMDNLLRFAMNDKRLEDNYNKVVDNNRMLVINHYAKDGKIIKKSGVDVNTSEYRIYDYLVNKPMLKNDAGNGVSKVAMSFIPVRSISKVINIIRQINKNLHVIGNEGSDLIYFRENEERIRTFLTL